MRIPNFLLILVLAVSALGQTVINGSRTITGAWNASGATGTLPAKTGTVAAMPATCTAGEQYWATNATAGKNLYHCTATDTWTQGRGAVTGTKPASRLLEE